MRRNKYNAKPVVIDGIKFHSQKEGRRYTTLKLLLNQGKISDLKTQVKFKFVHDGGNCGSYICDFTYIERGQYIVEDVKGVKTPMYNFKKKMMKAFFKIEIRET